MRPEELLFTALRGNFDNRWGNELVEAYELAKKGIEEREPALSKNALALLDENLREFRKEAMQKRWTRASIEISLAFLTAWLFDYPDPAKKIIQKEEEANNIAKSILEESKRLIGIKGRIQKEGRVLRALIASILYGFLTGVQYYGLKPDSSIKEFLNTYNLTPVFIKLVKECLEEQAALDRF